MDYFDYFHRDYGSPQLHINKFKFFLHIEATCVMGVHELDLIFYYRVDNDNILEIILHDGEDGGGYAYHIAGRFRLHEPFYRGLLKGYIREFIRGVRMYYGMDYDFHGSPVMSEREFRDLLEDIEADRRITEYLTGTRWADSALKRLCEDYGLHIFNSSEKEHKQ